MKRKYSKHEAFELGHYELEEWPEADEAERMSEKDWYLWIDKHGMWTVPINVVVIPKVAKLYKKAGKL